ncbi:MAG: glycosyltransferase family 25 protein [Thiobacillaceae bacterium]|nr:glycosyltransferase family 25 protein [Thiobacillaceae bacterium]
MKPFTPRLFVINLERSSDRRESIAAQLGGLGIDFELFPATDGARLSQNDLAQYHESHVVGQIARPMSPSEVGCYLSHTRLWKKIVAEDIPWAVVLEDDVDIHDDLTGILAAIDKIPFQWDYIRLAGLGPTPSFRLYDLNDKFALSVLFQGASGTQANCISRAGAKRLLDYATPLIRGTIDDHVIDNCWKTGLRSLAVQPYPISENKNFVSSIETERRKIFQENRTKPKKMTFRYWAIRRRYKLGRSIDRRMYAIIHALFWLKQKARCTFIHHGDKHCPTVTAGANTANKP